MRRCHYSDLFAAASVVAAAAVPERAKLTDQLIVQADAAHRYTKRLGHAHPYWGNGSLMSRALLEPQSRHFPPHSPAFLSALALIAMSLSDRKRASQPNMS